MERDYSTSEPDWISRLPWIALATLLGLLFAFSYRFAQKFADSSVWGQLGDFVGGMVNPFLAFMSLLVLLQTMREQRYQLKVARAHSVLEELQRLMSTIASSLDEALNSPLATDSVIPNLDTTEWLGQQRDAARKRGENLHWSINPKTVAEGINIVRSVLMWKFPQDRSLAISGELTGVRERLLALDWVVKKFLANGGAQEIADFYGYRYSGAALTVALIGPEYKGYGRQALVRLGLQEDYDRAANLLANLQKRRDSTPT